MSHQVCLQHSDLRVGLDKQVLSLRTRTGEFPLYEQPDAERLKHPSQVVYWENVGKRALMVNT